MNRLDIEIENDNNEEIDPKKILRSDILSSAPTPNLNLPKKAISFICSVAKATRINNNMLSARSVFVKDGHFVLTNTISHLVISPERVENALTPYAIDIDTLETATRLAPATFIIYEKNNRLFAFLGSGKIELLVPEIDLKSLFSIPALPPKPERPCIIPDFIDLLEPALKVVSTVDADHQKVVLIKNSVYACGTCRGKFGDGISQSFVLQEHDAKVVQACLKEHPGPVEVRKNRDKIFLIGSRWMFTIPVLNTNDYSFDAVLNPRDPKDSGYFVNPLTLKKVIETWSFLGDDIILKFTGTSIIVSHADSSFEIPSERQTDAPQVTVKLSRKLAKVFSFVSTKVSSDLIQIYPRTNHIDIWYGEKQFYLSVTGNLV